VAYLSLLSKEEEDAVDEAGEQLLLSEIGKFRTRQLQRDKEVEEQRKEERFTKIQLLLGEVEEEEEVEEGEEQHPYWEE
jgi:hypothetical protein